MTDRIAELNLLTNHHDRHWTQMEIAHVEGRKADAEYHRLEMGRGEERALEIEGDLQDEYRDRANRDLMARYAACDAGPAYTAIEVEATS